MAILAGWILVIIVLFIVYLLALPVFYKIGAKIYNYLYTNTIYKTKVEENDSIKLEKERK